MDIAPDKDWRQLGIYPPLFGLIGYGKCSKISNTLKLRTPKIIAENNFEKHPKKSNTALFRKSEFLKLRTRYFRRKINVRLSVCPICVRYISTVQHVSGSDI